MARKKVIVKTPECHPELRGMDVLCTDKTGTLTQGKMCSKSIWTQTANPARSAAVRLHPQLLPYRLKNLLDEANPQP